MIYMLVDNFIYNYLLFKIDSNSSHGCFIWQKQTYFKPTSKLYTDLMKLPTDDHWRIIYLSSKKYWSVLVTPSITGFMHVHKLNKRSYLISLI